MTETKQWTADEIKAKLKQEDAEGQAWVEHAVKAIYKFQTASEQAMKQTMEDNGVGFNGVDAELLSSFAEQLISGKLAHLTPNQMPYARKKILKYSGQLARIANGEVM
jgi:hypothetical protein